MKTIDTYITERLKLNNDSKIKNNDINNYVCIIPRNTDYDMMMKKYKKYFVERTLDYHKGYCFVVPKKEALQVWSDSIDKYTSFYEIPEMCDSIKQFYNLFKGNFFDEDNMERYDDVENDEFIFKENITERLKLSSIDERLRLNNDSKIAPYKLEKIGCKEFIKLINGNTDFGKFKTPKWDKDYRKFLIYNGRCYEIQNAMRGKLKEYIFVINYYFDDTVFVIRIFEEEDNRLSIIMEKIYAQSFSRVRKVSELNRGGRSCYLNRLIVDEFIDMMNDIKNNCKYDADMLNKFNECDEQWYNKKYYID